MRDGPGGITYRCFGHRGLRGHRGLGWSLFLSVVSVTSVANDSFAMRCAPVGGGVRLRDPVNRECFGHRGLRGQRGLGWSLFLSVVSVTSVANDSFAMRCAPVGGGVRLRDPVNRECFATEDSEATEGCGWSLFLSVVSVTSVANDSFAMRCAPVGGGVRLRDPVNRECFGHRGLRGQRGLGWSLFLSVVSVTSVANDSFAMRCAPVGGGVRLRDPVNRECFGHRGLRGQRGLGWSLFLSVVSVTSVANDSFAMRCAPVGGGVRLCDPVNRECFCHRGFRGHRGLRMVSISLCGLGDLCGK
ncbi:hypothetical protein Poly24_55050 [Rosistilla carotiformis]|uniref:Uncharacterized protein n=1 Tax=Rosistilla carotiformis TaxID=2528017 RepID=A0A518K1X8_9BACT|nr:hypothetical protein Poly24_55050 [Rosistilla carotiformis]